jgi:hypothetical protein
MGDRRLVILVLAMQIALPLAGQTSARSLPQICSLYIDELGRESGADIIRERIRGRLERSSRFQIVQSATSADAILTGAAAIEQHTYVHEGTGGSHWRGAGLFRVVDAATGQTIWNFEYRPAFEWSFRNRSASDRVAEKTVQQLLNDAGTTCSVPPSAEKPERLEESRVGLRGVRTFCVLADDPAATSAAVLTLRDLLPTVTFTDSPTDCRTAQAIFFYNTKAGWGDVFIRSRATPAGALGVRLDVLAKGFVEAWTSANAPPAHE